MIAWLLYCFAKTGHEFALEKVYRTGYTSIRNMQRKNWMILMSLSALGAVLTSPPENIVLFVLWAYSIQEFIHEFGLAWLRGDVSKFGEVGTSALRDVAFRRLGIGKGLARVYFTLPAVMFSYLIWGG